MRYQWELPNRLAGHVELFQIEAARADLEHVLTVFERGPRRLDLRKLRCASVISFCARGALAAAAPSEDLNDYCIQALSELTRVRTWQSVRKLMHLHSR